MSKPFPFEPAMGPIDLALLETVLETLAPRFVLEWGSGGGTHHVLEHFPCIERYISIEHDDNWFELVKKHITDPRLELYLVPLDGALEEFEATRFPPSLLEKKKHKKMFDHFRKITEEHPEHTKSYVNRPRDFNVKFDFALVDGRGRNFCLPVAWELVRSGGVIILHDAQRPEYRTALKDLPHRIVPVYSRGQICLIRKP